MPVNAAQIEKELMSLWSQKSDPQKGAGISVTQGMRLEFNGLCSR